MSLTLSPSQEDYLETIFQIADSKDVVRVRDIAAGKNVSMPSVTGALKRLARQGLVSYSRYDYVRLTPRGKRLAGRLSDRHALLKRFLTDILRVDDRTADSDACTIEHHVSPTTIKALLRFFQFLDGRPDGGRRLLHAFRNAG
jgi:DtxR family Mn-dependent transcriptional regulator